MTFLATSNRALYSASVEERAMVDWSLLLQAMGEFPNLYKIPEVERRESESPAQSASVKVSRFPLSLEGKKSP